MKFLLIVTLVLLGLGCDKQIHEAQTPIHWGSLR